MSKTIAMKKRILATDFAVEATPLNPNIPAINDMIKKNRAHFNICSPPVRIKV